MMFVTEEKAPMSDDWTIYFDGTMNKDGSGVGVVLISPGSHWPESGVSHVRTNNVA